MKYKLIKTYPGSPKLHSIVEVKLDGYIHWNVNSNENNPTNYIHNSSMKQYEEFWEKVVEKDYEILSFINVNNKIYKLRFDGHYFNDELKYNDYQYCLNVLKIHSIKRLSDNVVFNIGDTVQLNDMWKYDCKIKEINIYNNEVSFTIQDKNISSAYRKFEQFKKVKCVLFTTEDNVEVINDETIVYWLQFKSNMWFEYGSTPYYSISVTSGNYKAFSTIEARKQWLNKKYPKPLFTTKDGVDIFKDDYYYPVEKSYYYLHEKQTNHHCTNEDKFWIFSTKEKAEEYILFNKPCLSINDVNVLKNIVFANWDKTLKDLVKSKIHQFAV